MYKGKINYSVGMIICRKLGGSQPLQDFVGHFKAIRFFFLSTVENRGVGIWISSKFFF